MATTKQIAFLNSLLAERAHQFSADVTSDLTKLTNKEASVIIDLLLKEPRRAVVVTASPNQPTLTPPTEPGMYRLASGEVAKVQAAKQTGNLYAKRLAAINGSRLTETDERACWEFVYEPGLIKQIDAASKLSLEEAKAFGIQYGVCCWCGAHLSDADSVAAGIGPVCAKRF